MPIPIARLASSLFIMLFALAIVTRAATFTVDHNGDAADVAPGNGVCATNTGTCTLRAAIQEANGLAGDDSVLFHASLSGQTIVLTGGALAISSNGALNISGPGANMLTVSGNNLSRVFTVNSGAIVFIHGITIANGRVTGFSGANGSSGNPNGGPGDPGGNAQGGGILNAGNVILSAVTLRDNTVVGGTGGTGGHGSSMTLNPGNGGNGGLGGLATGGAIHNSGTLKLLHCALRGNRATGGTGGRGGDAGTAFRSNGNGGLGGNSEGATFNSGTLLILNSTVSGELTVRGLGGIPGSGGTGGVPGALGSAIGGGLRNAFGGTIQARNATIAANQSGGSGGGLANSGTVSSANTLIGDNFGSPGPDVAGTVSSLGNNLIENISGVTITGTLIGNVTGVDPNLGPLQNNGGPTFTKALLSGSPAIDAGDNSLAADPANGDPLAVDQRGLQRIVSGIVDIGAFEFGAGVLCPNASIPLDLPTSQGSVLTVPINVSNLTGAGVISYDATITYDPTVLQPQMSPVDSTGTLSAGFEVNTGGMPGQILISAFGTQPISGGGILLNLKFDVIGEPPGFSNLNFSLFNFNEGNPCVNTTNGSVAVRGTISGTVAYGTASTFVPVPNVDLAGDGSIAVATTTSADGTYTLSNFGAGTYIVTPTKTGQVNAISAFDASLVSKFLVGTEALSPNQQAAADVSDNGAVTSFDAALVARFVVSLPDTGSTGTWVFIPASRSYQDIGTETEQDFEAILKGEVSGNWSPPASLLNKTRFAEDATSQTATVSLGVVSAIEGELITLPANITGAALQDVSSYQFTLLYDPAVLQPMDPAVDKNGTVSSGLSVVANTSQAGVLSVAVYGAGSITQDGVFLYFNFQVLGSSGSATPLTWQNFLLNEGEPAVSAVNGQVMVGAPSVPSPPGDLVASPVSSRRVDLMWSDNSNNEIGFSIERCKGKNCKNFSEIAQVGVSTSAYSDTAVTKNTEYRYRVRAWNAIGYSPFSQVASVKTSR